MQSPRDVQATRKGEEGAWGARLSLAVRHMREPPKKLDNVVVF